MSGGADEGRKFSGFVSDHAEKLSHSLNTDSLAMFLMTEHGKEQISDQARR